MLVDMSFFPPTSPFQIPTLLNKKMISFQNVIIITIITVICLSVLSSYIRRNFVSTHTIIKACLLTLTDKQARIHICTVTLSKNFCGRKQGVWAAGLAVWLHKSLSDTERLSGVLFIKLKKKNKKPPENKNVAHSKPFCAAFTSVCLFSCLGPFRFIKYIQCRRHL